MGRHRPAPLTEEWRRGPGAAASPARRPPAARGEWHFGTGAPAQPPTRSQEGKRLLAGSGLSTAPTSPYLQRGGPQLQLSEAARTPAGKRMPPGQFDCASPLTAPPSTPTTASGTPSTGRSTPSQESYWPVSPLAGQATLPAPPSWIGDATRTSLRPPRQAAPSPFLVEGPSPPPYYAPAFAIGCPAPGREAGAAGREGKVPQGSFDTGRKRWADIEDDELLDEGDYSEHPFPGSDTDSTCGGRGFAASTPLQVPPGEFIVRGPPPAPPLESPKLPPHLYHFRTPAPRMPAPTAQVYACVANAPEPKFAPPAAPAPLPGQAGIPAPPPRAPELAAKRLATQP